MATTSRRSAIEALRNLSSTTRELRENQRADLTRRQRATTILNPDEVAGEYDAGRLLITTLGGQVRAINHGDIQAFQTNVRNLKTKYRGGIKAQAVIDLSLPADRERANKEIPLALPRTVAPGKVTFITSAGPKSKKSRHQVMVQFLDFNAVVAASPTEPAKIAKLVVGGKLAFDCDCERHTFWFRYISTVGRFNAGRAETGYPKIRNPNLHGVACKHVLRTMRVLQLDSATHRLIAKSVLEAREALDMRNVRDNTVRANELREIAQSQNARRRSSANLSTSEERKVANTAKKAREKIRDAARQMAPKKDKKKILQNAQYLLSVGAITQDMYNTIVSNNS